VLTAGTIDAIIYILSSKESNVMQSIQISNYQDYKNFVANPEHELESCKHCGVEEEAEFLNIGLCDQCHSDLIEG
jgi:predicted Zn-ribbon and HTH transcriptional regulator